jgi:hypothetical protein
MRISRCVLLICRRVRAGERVDWDGGGRADVSQKDVFHEGKRGKVLSFGELLLAAGIAGMPAAYLTTP